MRKQEPVGGCLWRNQAKIGHGSAATGFGTRVSIHGGYLAGQRLRAAAAGRLRAVGCRARHETCKDDTTFGRHAVKRRTRS
jgi:hypothetical protein